MDTRPRIPSILGRLLYEVSWEGNAKHYRKGGRGRENVLTAEALQVLDWLPRQHFLGGVIDSMHGADAARAKLSSEIEDASVEMFPTDVLLRPSASAWQEQCSVQPDGLIESPSVFCFIEAKRIGGGTFQQKQLARELVATLIQARERTPLLMLVLGKRPPVAVSRHGRLAIRDAVDLALAHVVTKEAEECPLPLAEIESMVNECVCWTTWAELLGCVLRRHEAFSGTSQSVRKAVGRMVERLSAIIEWHS